MSQYFAMGGYAVFIWPCYALAVVLLVGALVLAARRLHAAKHALGGDDSDETDAAS
jgi:heme exporter protein CcmD